MPPITQQMFRILVADDEEKYLELYQHVLSVDSPFHTDSSVFEIPFADSYKSKFKITTCRQGDTAVDTVKQSIAENRPFSVAFLDVRMPPGPDGIWVAKQIRQIDPLIEIAIVTGYSDYTPEDIVSRIPPVHKLIYIQKPFRLKEIYHFANVLSAKRFQEHNILNINKSLEQKVAERTRELNEKNELLTVEINQRIRAEEALRKSEQSYRLLVEKQMDLIVKFDKKGKLLFAGTSYCIAMGKTQAQLLGKNFLSLVHKDEYARIAEAIDKTFEPPFSSYVEEKAQTRHGWRWYAWVFTGVPDKSGDINATLAVGRDITERKQTELDLKESRKKLQVLYSHLITAQEEERKRIASDLHDDLGQALAVLKLRIQSIQKKLSKDQVHLNKECDETLQHVNGVIAQIRRISHDLSPAALQDLGLAEALKSLADEFSKHARIKLIMDIANIDNLLPLTSEVIIYRVFQEILTNIQKHSNTAYVKIKVKRAQNQISFLIKDGGKGFDKNKLESKPAYEKGLGFSSMDERIKMLGGQLTVKSQIDKGTSLLFTIPFQYHCIS
ncbi:MAG: PAS domain S-box protein [Desulfobacterales bacterium]|jgi:PAS domain S-box-containing protein|nr:PAS domain S-box protein [Desulfobacterales bacterium]